MKKILIVEDDLVQGEAIAQQVRNILGDGIEIVGPLSGHREALSEVKKGKFDLALLDIELQDHAYGGIHVADTIRAKYKTPILFVTGIQNEKILKDTEEIDHSHFIQKPFDLAALERGLQQLIAVKDESQKSNHPKVFYKAGVRDKYWIKEGKNNLTNIHVKDILYVEAQDHYCRFFIKGKKPIMIKARLKTDIYENSLSAYTNFYQLGRSFIVNLDEIVRINLNKIQFEDESVAPIVIPKNSKKELFKLLKVVSEDD